MCRLLVSRKPRGAYFNTLVKVKQLHYSVDIHETPISLLNAFKCYNVLRLPQLESAVVLCYSKLLDHSKLAVFGALSFPVHINHHACRSQFGSVFVNHHFSMVSNTTHPVQMPLAPCFRSAAAGVQQRSGGIFAVLLSYVQSRHLRSGSSGPCLVAVVW